MCPLVVVVVVVCCCTTSGVGDVSRRLAVAYTSSMAPDVTIFDGACRTRYSLTSKCSTMQCLSSIRRGKDKKAKQRARSNARAQPRANSPRVSRINSIKNQLYLRIVQAIRQSCALNKQKTPKDLDLHSQKSYEKCIENSLFEQKRHQAHNLICTSCSINIHIFLFNKQKQK